MESQNRKPHIGVLLLYVFFGFSLLYQFNGSYSEPEIWLYAELIVTYFWTAGLLVYAAFQLDLYLFEPITFIGILYELIFVIKPIIDLRSRNMYEHGINTFPGGEKITLVFLAGFTLMFFAYYTTATKEKRTSVQSANNSNETIEIYRPYLLYASWTIVFVLCIVGMNSQGLSLRYIFSLSSHGERVVNNDNVALLFLSNFGITLLSVWMMIIFCTKNTAVKIVTSLLVLLYLLMRNARWLMLVFLAAPLTYYYTTRKRSPRWGLVIAIGLIGLTIFAWMQANRAVLHSGGTMQGWGEEGFGMGFFLAPFDSDLNTYRAVYAAARRFPENYDFLYGNTFLYTLVLFVPRIIWKTKPDNPNHLVIQHALNRQARESGTAMSNVGEFYVNFGVVGVLLGMILVGVAARYLKYKFLKHECDSNQMLLYSVLFPLLFQWIARGNFCGNFYVTIFAILPFVVYSFFATRRKESI